MQCLFGEGREKISEFNERGESNCIEEVPKCENESCFFFSILLIVYCSFLLWTIMCELKRQDLDYLWLTERGFRNASVRCLGLDLLSRKIRLGQLIVMMFLMISETKMIQSGPLSNSVGKSAVI